MIYLIFLYRNLISYQDFLSFNIKNLSNSISKCYIFPSIIIHCYFWFHFFFTPVKWVLSSKLLRTAKARVLTSQMNFPLHIKRCQSTENSNKPYAEATQIQSASFHQLVLYQLTRLKYLKYYEFYSITCSRKIKIKQNKNIFHLKSDIEKNCILYTKIF